MYSTDAEKKLTGYSILKLDAVYFSKLHKKIFNQLHKIKSVDGRLDLVSNLKNNSNIIVDFAHTPDALEQSLIAVSYTHLRAHET